MGSNLAFIALVDAPTVGRPIVGRPPRDRATVKIQARAKSNDDAEGLFAIACLGALLDTVDPDPFMFFFEGASAKTQRLMLAIHQNQHKGSWAFVIEDPPDLDRGAERRALLAQDVIQAARTGSLCILFEGATDVIRTRLAEFNNRIWS
jgi:hypothetical protein